jgi:hypothetical protein
VVAVSEAGWAFLGIVVVQFFALAGLYVQSRKTSTGVAEVNRAVNHQPTGSATLVQRVGSSEDEIASFKAETAEHRRWEHRLFRSMGNHVGFTVPAHPTEDDGTQVQPVPRSA